MEGKEWHKNKPYTIYRKFANSYTRFKRYDEFSIEDEFSDPKYVPD